MESIINDKKAHSAIAEKVCGWVWGEVELDARWTPEGFVKYQCWHVPSEISSDEDIMENYGKDTPFLDARPRELAIEAARMKGWSIEICSYSPATFSEVGYSWTILGEGYESDPRYTRTKPEAEFEALAHIANKI